MAERSRQLLQTDMIIELGMFTVRVGAVEYCIRGTTVSQRALVASIVDELSRMEGINMAGVQKGVCMADEKEDGLSLRSVPVMLQVTLP